MGEARSESQLAAPPQPLTRRAWRFSWQRLYEFLIERLIWVAGISTIIIVALIFFS